MSAVTQVQPAVPIDQTLMQGVQECPSDLSVPRIGHAFEFYPNPKTRTWERLESIRLQKLGLSKNYSRHFNVTRSHCRPSCQGPLSFSFNGQIIGEKPRNLSKFQGAGVSSGSFAPFHSQGKPTCGYFFSRDTDNKKQRIGIPAANLVKWRSFNAEELR